MQIRLPELLQRKIYKTGQTRGADDDVIFQNRVGRNSTVLIPYSLCANQIIFPEGENSFENGYIVLIPPEVFFNERDIINALKRSNLSLGQNCVVFYETRGDWDRNNPVRMNWAPAQSRNPPLLGQFVARIPATTAFEGGERINLGFTTTNCKGAGIRGYEYASSETLRKTRLQLEAIYWLCFDSVEVVINHDLNRENAECRKKEILDRCAEERLFDIRELQNNRIINHEERTICPLCLDLLSGEGFFNRLAQAEGRDVPDLTVTEINLFHVNELRYGVFNHKPYNLGWGHHHCNVVTKDSGIQNTIGWMRQVLERNNEYRLE